MQKLGSNQLAVLQCLADHGSWDSGKARWFWNTHSGTKRILERLAERGLVVRTHPSPNNQAIGTCYSLNTHTTAMIDPLTVIKDALAFIRSQKGPKGTLLRDLEAIVSVHGRGVSTKTNLVVVK